MHFCCNYYTIVSDVAQLCLTLCNPMDCSLPGSSVHGIFQAIVLEWIATSFSRGSSQHRDQMVKPLSTMQETWVRSLGREGPWRRKWQSTLVLLPGKSHGQRSLVGYSPWGCKELDSTERLHFPVLLAGKLQGQRSLEGYMGSQESDMT